MKTYFTSASIKDFKVFVNLEHKSLSSCFRTILKYWNNSDLQKVARKDGLNREDLTPAYLIKWLEGTNYCQNGVLGRMVIVDKETKAKEFREWTTWTPGRVLDYLRRASKAHCESLGI